MAFTHGKDVTLTVGSTSLQGEIVDTSLDIRKTLAELSLIGATSVQRLAGLEDSTMIINGAADSTTLETLLSYMQTGDPVSVTYAFGTTTLTVSMLIESISISASSTDAVRFTANLSATGAVAVS